MTEQISRLQRRWSVGPLIVLVVLGGYATRQANAASVPLPSEQADNAVRAPANAPPGIAWFDGSLPAAFVLAKREHRPVLLFWGAQWCPFCHTLKATVFARPDFIAKTQLFVPVYLDGDDAGAQRWGEQFGVMGYPTLVVLDSDRHEIIRLGAGRDVSEYAVVLDAALDNLQPIDALLPLAAARQPLSADACRRLAYNSWDLMAPDPASSGLLAQQLQAAAKACPATLEHAVLTIYAAKAAADATRTSPKGQPASASPRLADLTDEVSQILAQPPLALSSAPALQSLDASFFQAVRALNPGLTLRLRDGYVAAMDAAATDARFVQADQLGFIDAKLVALKASGGAHYQFRSEALSAANQRVDAALAAEQNPYVRPGLVNASLGILEDSAQYAKAYQIARVEIERSDAPYYYQADLAEIAEKLGHQDEAIGLLDAAYQGSRGPATRFQWGQLYVSGLLRMAPQDVTRIQQQGLQVLGELDGTDRIAGRARVRLAQLDRELRAWNTANHDSHGDVLQTLRARVQQICVKIPLQDPTRVSCDAFLIDARHSTPIG